MRWRLLSWCLVASAVAGCWSEEPRIDGFTAEQWTALQARFALPVRPDLCSAFDELPDREDKCVKAMELGQKLFFEPTMSIPSGVACASCHDPKTWLADTRVDNALSKSATGFTKRNTISLVNAAYKAPGTFTWIGLRSPAEVITKIALPKAMGATPTSVLAGLDAIPNGRELYETIWPSPGPDELTVGNIATALEVYTRRFVSFESPFDEYIAGNALALDDASKHGFELFVGRAMCIECHSGPLFTDGKFHVTGVAQTSEDQGRMLVTTARTDLGKFATPPLRHVANTGPYMHAGSVRTLGEVIELYRWGGDSAGYLGDKDPLMEPLDLSDDDMQDLEAFLRTLTGSPVDSALSQDIR